MSTSLPRQPVPESNHRPRLRREAPPGLFVLAAVLTAIFLFYAEENWRGRRAWDAHTAVLRARGEPTDLSFLVVPDIPDAENFAKQPFIASIVAGETKAVPIPDLDAYLFLSHGGPMEIERDLMQQIRGAGPAASFRSAGELLQLYAPMETQLAGLRDAAQQRPRSQFPGILRPGQKLRPATGVPWANLGEIFRLYQILHAHALANLAGRRTDLALDDLRVIRKLAEASAGGQSLLGAMISLAMFSQATDLLRVDSWSATEYLELQQVFRSIDLSAAINRGIRAERLYSSSLFGPDSDTGTSLARVFGSDAVPTLVAWAPRGWFMLAAVQQSEETLQVLASGLGEKPARYSKLRTPARPAPAEGDRTSWNPYRRIQFLFSSRNLRTVAAYAAEDISRINLAILQCALERHRLETGKYPGTLAELAPRFVDPLPIDLFSGKSYGYRRSGNGKYVIYSVGADEQDDGGIEGKDIVWPPR